MDNLLGDRRIESRSLYKREGHQLRAKIARLEALVQACRPYVEQANSEAEELLARIDQEVGNAC